MNRLFLHRTFVRVSLDNGFAVFLALPSNDVVSCSDDKVDKQRLVTKLGRSGHILYGWRDVDISVAR